uniref:Uncharacterized protein n=1 Tax=Candidatus Kentrum sp. TUN TaxID=2126343 RepID=A0A450Z9S1_9GAMM|nr:MAG: hypothetical protein BECKTUN1418E_GA0071001_100348 [Candidatus Kentron sp. TUN]VFK51755.1 MAG: hypothetical protein BECKTUN1418F_GA0071002_100348 [Candidatus Kentron sp. TUN]
MMQMRFDDFEYAFVLDKIRLFEPHSINTRFQEFMYRKNKNSDRTHGARLTLFQSRREALTCSPYIPYMNKVPAYGILT